MDRYVALLRGLNVGGKNKVSMAALKELFSRKYKNVETHGNTGVIFFDTEEMVSIYDIETDFQRMFGFKIGVYLLSDMDVYMLNDMLPLEWNKDKKWRHNVLFLLNGVKAEQICPNTESYDENFDKVEIHDNVIFWSSNFTTRQLYYKSDYRKILNHPNYCDLTIRNGNTFSKMVSILKRRAITSNKEEVL